MADDEDLDRGAELRLAQRHKVIVPGVLHGKKLWEAALHSPGTTGAATLSVSTTGPLPKDSKIVLEFPDTGWTMPPNPNVTIKASLGRPAPRAKAIWNGATLDITTLDEDIEARASLAIIVSGVTTPACATPSGELIATTFEQKIVRNTMPVSFRGGQIIDGPTKITIPTLAPGALVGAKRWAPFNCCPLAVADVFLDFRVTGAVPNSGKILVELPTDAVAADRDGWTMAEHPRVTAKLRPPGSANVGFAATWLQDQHVLELVVTEGCIPMHTTVQLTIAQVTNPASECPPTVARVTTLIHNGVIDGPAKMDVPRISELRECDFAAAAAAFHAQESKDDMLPLAKVVQALAAMSIAQTEASLQGQVRVVSVEQPVDVVPVLSKKGAADSTPAQPKVQEFVRLEDYLNFFTTIYAPAFKFGEDLRTAAGRGQVDRMQDLIQCGCDPNAKDGAGWTALHYAAEHGAVKAVNVLLDQPQVDLNTRDVAGWTPLMCAASNGHVPVLARLLEMGADIRVKSAEGRTALHWAATRGIDAAVGFLVLGGANVDAVDRSGWTPLHCAAVHGNVGCAKVLLDHGATATAVDALGHPAWEYWDAPAVTVLQAHMEKLDTMGVVVKKVVAAT
ncbi:hypothetical protein H310_07691 [Aphanomyces invadans]|uniref:Uncharacterized protein n=1 Tax=Aphanomyces invadans TaxID=157072 RepID=A0A024U278_9STRA|nr:hypothetical protein H310_07691 [Aphanomyces invadans]ETW00320.1 hypothetical protein H310_07691 [Aphanomyces invadans]|eukprot:XP_008871345.1 hypothetical protein H310_07691 [Aphanomyces invadans]